VPFGEVLISSLIAALAANPKVWAKTAFILNYDENDGFFDHMPAPMPAIAPRYGASNVDVRSETYQGEPVGLGPRVPMMVISPWTRGGWVNSQLFDHTSVLRFLERRFGVAEPNISPWRRASCGDLTSIFDFDVPHKARFDTDWLKALPSVAGYVEETERLCRTAPAPAIATGKGVPAQEPGTRPARALPYRFAVEPHWTGDGLTLRFVNEGTAGVIFGVQDELAFPGWQYFTVAAGSQLEESWPVPADHAHALTIRGPNGFQRDFRGANASLRITAMIDWREDGTGGTLRITNPGSATSVVLHCAHSGRADHIAVAAGAGTELPLPLPDHRWYDLLLTAPHATALRLSGHVETGRPGTSEPAARFPHPD
jgi:phospholipase C